MYVMGRLREGSKLWTCCNSSDHLSLRCPSWEARRERQAQLAREAEQAMQAEQRRAQAAQFR